MTLATTLERLPAAPITDRLNGLSYHPGHALLDRDTWEADGLVFSRMDAYAKWWLGDWILWGEANYGATYAQAEAFSGYSPSSLQNFAWVAGKFEASRRRDKPLSWGHHAEVAALPAAAADTWLNQAQHEGWSVHTLRARVRGTGHTGHPLPDEVDRLTAPFTHLDVGAWLATVAEHHQAARAEALALALQRTQAALEQLNQQLAPYLPPEVQ